MVIKLVGAWLCLLALGSARADLLLAPEPIGQNVDGVNLKLLAFSDDDKRVTYQPPANWDYSGTADKLTLRPRNNAQAGATVRRVRLPQPGSFTEEELKKLVTEVPTLIPERSENIRVVSQEMNPLLINRKDTFQVVVDYIYYGQEFKSSILFLNRGNDQLRFQLISSAADFNGLQRAFQESLYTWHNL